jgi:hypothetical protein
MLRYLLDISPCLRLPRKRQEACGRGSRRRRMGAPAAGAGGNCGMER